MKPSDLKKLKKKLPIMILGAILIVGAFLFLPAWSFNFWQAWIFMGVLFIPLLFVAAYFLKHNPEFVVRRLQYKEKEVRQKLIIKIANISFFIGFLMPGFDFRYGWSNIPVWLVIAGNIVVMVSYLFIFRVFKENSYASRIIEVQKGQKVISTGPYAVIRHPMYAGIIPMYLGIPFALGSYYELPFLIPVFIVIILRILNEEEVLKRDLKGYKEYTKKVKYRLIPGIW